MTDLRRAFERYDKDQNGYISGTEAHEVLSQELGFSLEHTRRLIQVYDRNGDGRLSYEEFIWFYWKIQEKKTQLLALFQDVDKDGSQSISFEEAKIALKDLNFTDSQLSDLMRLHDTNSDGLLQYDEFVHFWQAIGDKMSLKH